MNCAWISEDEAMALTDHDRDWIRLTMAEALRQHSSGWITRFKSWSPLGALAGIGLFFLLQWNASTVFRTHTEDRLDRIEGDIRALRTAATLQTAIAASNVNAPKAIKDARDAINRAAKQSPSDVNLGSLSLKVAEKAMSVADQQNDQSVKVIAWQTVQAAVNYASSQAAPPALRGHNLRDCIEGRGPKNGIGGMFDEVFSKDRKSVTIIPKRSFHNCVLTLDRVNNPSIILTGPFLFQDCIIRYSGGPPMLVGDLEFKNCLFILTLNAPPTDQGSWFAKTLVESGLVHAEVPKSNS